MCLWRGIWIQLYYQWMWESDLSVSGIELLLSITYSVNYFNDHRPDSFNSALSMQIKNKIIDYGIIIKDKRTSSYLNQLKWRGWR